MWIRKVWDATDEIEMLPKRERFELMSSTFGERLIGCKILKFYREEKKALKSCLIAFHPLLKYALGAEESASWSSRLKKKL